MSKISFIFIVIAFLLIPLEEITSFHFQKIETVCCIILIATIGVSHGAIDNYLYGFKSQLDNLRFIGLYILAAIGFALVWYFSQNIAFLIFIIISAFHFGQSQFSDLNQGTSLLKKILYTAWGTWLLMSFIYLNQHELADSYSQSDFNMRVMTIALNYSFIGFIVSGIAILSVFTYWISKDLMTIQRLFSELYQAFIIMVVFKLSSPLLAFTLYFVILHSGRVLEQEFNYLLKTQKITNLFSFVKLLMPFTTLSIIGLLFFAFVVYYFQISFSWPLVAIIFISCLTFPHSFVMDWFYSRTSA